ncbi:hypothetical protein ACUNV4_25680 [Granulosicoccus sp. 3-233]|uniref:hypothetical protein n=1 Tax=Granulosicoccus sp. 3-233 TaxID=3417969 RepID=UPI003D32F274
MSKKQQSDSVVVWDRASRRQFMRTGAGFLLVGGALTASRGVRADDCDRNGQQRESSADQDSGENSDPKGCQSRNIVSEHQPQRTAPVQVKRIKA